MDDQCTALRLGVTRVIVFLEDIGIPVSVRQGASGFLDLVSAEAGGLVIDPACSASNLLHEAGHLAIIPGQFRPMAQGDLSDVEQAMGEAMLLEPPDSPLARAVLQASEGEASAWAWAAGMHLGLPSGIVIQDEDYDGGGALVRSMLSAGRHFGVHGLHHAGFCDLRGPGAYPVMRHWVQPDIPSMASSPGVPGM